MDEAAIDSPLCLRERICALRRSLERKDLRFLDVCLLLCRRLVFFAHYSTGRQTTTVLSLAFDDQDDVWSFGTAPNGCPDRLLIDPKAWATWWTMVLPLLLLLPARFVFPGQPGNELIEFCLRYVFVRLFFVSLFALSVSGNVVLGEIVFQDARARL